MLYYRHNYSGEENKMKCFYHTDMDGKCAGAIVFKAMKNQENDDTGFAYLPINYKDDFPFENIQGNEQVIIVDFSLQKPGEWEKLLSITKNIIWIDHHKTAIEKAPIEVQKLRGIRKDGVAGCVLTWQYFNPRFMCPQIVEMLGAYDIWDFSKYGEDLNILQAGIRLFDHEPESKNWTVWFDCFNGDYCEVNKILEKGRIVLQYRNNYWAGLIKSWSFWTTFEGHKAICCNAGSVSSQLFDSVKEDYDLMIPFVFDGKQWTVSLYTKKDIDCAEIAKKYGGGGHKQAAGFQCKELPLYPTQP